MAADGIVVVYRAARVAAVWDHVEEHVGVACRVGVSDCSVPLIVVSPGAVVHAVQYVPSI